MNRTWIILIDGCYAEPGRVKGIYPHLHSDYLGATRNSGNISVHSRGHESRYSLGNYGTARQFTILKEG